MRNEPISMRAKYAVLPLDHLLSILNSKDATKAERFEAAKVAAPYMHQRLSAVVLTNDSEPRQTTLDLTRFTDDEVATFEVLLAKAQAQPPTLPTPAFDPEADEEYLCPSWKPGDPIS
ncbi:MAG TPA: hypothetical protein VFB02_16605 [Bradyrhizobium sp.]|nr:hypothetical protein [Bradyrhizobium sp.]